MLLRFLPFTTHRPASPNPCPRRSQAADNFSCFLEKENELETVGVGEGRASASSATLGDDNHSALPPRLPAAIASGRGLGREGGNSPASRKEEEGEREDGQEAQREEELRKRRAYSPAAAEWAGNASFPAVGSEGLDVGIGEYGDIDGGGRSCLDDVTRPMPAETDYSGMGAEGGTGRGGGDDVGRGLSGIFQQKKGPTLLEDRGD